MLEEQQPGQKKGGEARGQGDGTDLGLGSPPKSILKGPVLARGTTPRGQPQGRFILMHAYFLNLSYLLSNMIFVALS